MVQKRRSRAQRKAEIEDSLILAARRSVYSGGPDVSVHDIAREAGVAVGTIYNHYESKADLFAAAGVRSFAEFNAWIEPVVSKIDDPALRLATFGRFMIRMPDSHIEHAHVLWHTQRFVWGPRYRPSQQGELERDLRAGIAAGRFDATLIEAKSITILGAILHFIGLRILDPKLPVTRGDDVVEVAMTILGVPSKEAHRLCHGRLPRRPKVATD